MRFYTQLQPFYCGVDLRAKTMHVCVVNQAGEILVHRNLPSRSDLSDHGHFIGVGEL